MLPDLSTPHEMPDRRGRWRDAASRTLSGSTPMLDINGFLTSTEFVAQIASIITAVFSALFGQFLTGLFTV